MLSSLTFWSPIFGDLDYLPNMIFPFIKVYRNDLFSCFEVVMSVLGTIFWPLVRGRIIDTALNSLLTIKSVNYCQGWWDYFPNPPIEVLNGLNELMTHFEPELYEHFRRNIISSQVILFLLLV